MTLYSITELIIECAHPCIKLTHILLYCRYSARAKIAACPRLTVHNYLFAVLEAAVKRLADRIHRINIVYAHKVKAEAVYMVFVCPVQDGVCHILSVHKVIACSFVAAA